MVQMDDIKSLNDFKLLQMGWIYDVNFRRAFQIAKERRYLEKIRRALPEEECVVKVFDLAMMHLQKNAR